MQFYIVIVGSMWFEKKKDVLKYYGKSENNTRAFNRLINKWVVVKTWSMYVTKWDYVLRNVKEADRRAKEMDNKVKMVIKQIEDKVDKDDADAFLRMLWVNNDYVIVSKAEYNELIKLKDNYDNDEDRINTEYYIRMDELHCEWYDKIISWICSKWIIKWEDREELDAMVERMKVSVQREVDR